MNPFFEILLNYPVIFPFPAYNEILSRFYLAFESVFEYVTNLNNYINELNEGNYLQYSLESIAQDAEGKQLLVWTLISN